MTRAQSLRAVAGNRGTEVTVVSDGLSEAGDVHGFFYNLPKVASSTHL